MKMHKLALSFAVFFSTVIAVAAAEPAKPNETFCVQGTYSLPCPKVIWCPSAKCGVGVPEANGQLRIIFSSEASMLGTSRRPMQAGSPMTLQNIVGKVIVFEWEAPGDVHQPGADLEVKSILYVVMPPQHTG